MIPQIILVSSQTIYLFLTAQLWSDQELPFCSLTKEQSLSSNSSYHSFKLKIVSLSTVPPHFLIWSQSLSLHFISLSTTSSTPSMLSSQHIYKPKQTFLFKWTDTGQTLTGLSGNEHKVYLDFNFQSFLSHLLTGFTPGAKNIHVFPLNPKSHKSPSLAFSVYS